jgi:toxin CptA
VQFPIVIGLHRSRFLDAGFGMVLASAAMLILLWPQATPFRLVALPAIALAGWLGWRQLSPALSAIRLESDGRMSVMTGGDAEFVAATPLPGAFVHPWLCVVRLKMPDGRVKSLNATVGTLNRQNFRRLRAFLRWRAKFSEPADAA